MHQRLILVLFMLLGCRESTDPRVWLTTHGYTPIYIERWVESSLGPMRCDPGYDTWHVAAQRAPRDEPCELVDVRMFLCQSGNQFVVYETSAWCSDRSTNAKPN